MSSPHESIALGAPGYKQQIVAALASNGYARISFDQDPSRIDWHLQFLGDLRHPETKTREYKGFSQNMIKLQEQNKILGEEFHTAYGHNKHTPALGVEFCTVAGYTGGEIGISRAPDILESLCDANESSARIAELLRTRSYDSDSNILTRYGDQFAFTLAEEHPILGEGTTLVVKNILDAAEAVQETLTLGAQQGIIYDNKSVALRHEGSQGPKETWQGYIETVNPQSGYKPGFSLEGYLPNRSLADKVFSYLPDITRQQLGFMWR